MLEIKICDLENLNEISQLVKNVFDEFVAETFTPEGINNFYKIVDKSNLERRIKKESIIWGAFQNEKLLGILELSENRKIKLLFVDKSYQNLGIAKSLFNNLINYSKKNELKVLCLNSSEYAYKFYKHLGFKKESEFIKYNGMKTCSMILRKPFRYKKKS